MNHKSSQIKMSGKTEYCRRNYDTVYYNKTQEIIFKEYTSYVVQM